MDQYERLNLWRVGFLLGGLLLMVLGGLLQKWGVLTAEFTIPIMVGGGGIFGMAIKQFQGWKVPTGASDESPVVIVQQPVAVDSKKDPS
jgi:hypothetical protein